MKLRHFDGFAVLLVLFLFVGGLLAHAQVGGSIAPAPANGPSYSPASNPQHASQHDLATPQTLLGNNAVTVAQGERPLSDFPTYHVETPLGDVAREYREEHAKLPKDERAQIHWNQQ
jgi:hypothetical protein